MFYYVSWFKCINSPVLAQSLRINVGLADGGKHTKNERHSHRMKQRRSDGMKNEWRLNCERSNNGGILLTWAPKLCGTRLTQLRLNMKDIRQTASRVPSFLSILTLFNFSLLFPDVAESISVCPEYIIAFRTIAIDTFLQTNLLKPSGFFT
jgi:hypothetical protein